MKKLRIAQVVLPWIALPPRSYAGTERIVYYLTEELVRRGHEVTLFATGDSTTSAKLSAILPKSLGLQDDVSGKLKSSFYPWMHVAEAFRRYKEFDVIHSHAQFIGLPFGAICPVPSVHTFHRIFAPILADEEALLKQYRHLNFTSVSNTQRIEGLNYIATVFNGTDTKRFVPLAHAKREYLFWAGRIIEKKGVREAIAIAKRCHFPLIIAGKITEQEYFDTYVRDEIDGKMIQFVNNATQEQMTTLYQHAKATLIPVKWNEPFGLTTVESMSCGTPVVAYANGGIKETVIDGIGGYIVDEKRGGIEALTKKTQALLAMDAATYDSVCEAARNHVERHFSITKMVDGYEAVYERLLATSVSK